MKLAGAKRARDDAATDATDDATAASTTVVNVPMLIDASVHDPSMGATQAAVATTTTTAAATVDVVEARLAALHSALSTLDPSSQIYLSLVGLVSKTQDHLNLLLTNAATAASGLDVAATVNPLLSQVTTALASGNYLAASNVLVAALDNRVKAPADRGTYSNDELLLFSKNLLGPDTIDREPALEQVRGYLKLAFGDHGSLLGTWAAPGSGKTHLLAHAARCMVSSEWTGPRGRRLVPLLVTFNGDSQLGVLGVRGVIVRILATFFCGVVESDNWASLATRIDAVLPADCTVQCALSIVRAHAGVDATLVVLLDEVAKCLGIDMVDPKTPDEVVSIRRQFYGPLRSTKLVMTTLNFVIGKDVTGSCAKLTWVDLPALQYDPVIAASAVAAVMTGEREEFKPFVALLGGHARSLANLVEALSKHDDVLTREKMNDLCKIAADGHAIPTRAIATLLLGFSVVRDGTELSAMIESGIANGGLFGFSNNKGMKPAVSFYALRGQLARTDDGFWPRERCLTVSKLLDIIFHNAGDGGLGFETMHAHVMAIRSVARVVARLEGVKYLGNMPLFKEEQAIDPLFKEVEVPTVTGAVLLWGSAVSVRDTARSRVVQLSHALSSPQIVPVLGQWSIAKTSPVVAVDTIDSSTVYLPGERNPGFDIVELYEVAADPADPAAAAGKHLVLTETKYSDANATTTFDIADARGKLANVNMLLERTLTDASSPIVRAGITSADQVTLLFALHRDHTNVVSAQIKAVALGAGYRFNIAVVTKPQLRELYGPTLAPLFDFQAGTFAHRTLPYIATSVKESS